MKDIKITRDNKLDIKLTILKYARYWGPKIDYWFRTSGQWPKETE